MCKDLNSLGFVELKSAPSVFKREGSFTTTFILVYVDDLLIAANDKDEVAKTVSNLEHLYKLRKNETVNLFLGVTLKWSQCTDGTCSQLSMSQKFYTESILRKFNMLDCKSAQTPMIEGFFTGINSTNKDVLDNILSYQQMAGSLLYLGLKCRPDILAPVSILSRFQKSPSNYCFQAAKRVLRYLKGTIDFELIMKPGDITLYAYVDSDYAGDTIDRKSMTGFLMKIGHGLISWAAKKQSSVALSTCEAEYFAMSVAGQEILWLRSVLAEMGFPCKSPTALHSDNISGISWAKGSKMPLKRAKHIDVRAHFIREQHKNGTINCQYVQSDENIADMMTKPLGSIKLQRFCAQISLQRTVAEEC